jgi:hypothetical protein
MKNLKTVENVVVGILNENKETRESDDILYLHVCEYFCEGVSSMTLKDFLTARKETNCPNFETVRRTRQKVFEKHPELKPEKITELRESMIDIFVDYAINS